MSYVIMRMKKLKTRASVASSGRHNFRERETPNADASLTITNSRQGAKYERLDAPTDDEYTTTKRQT